MPIRCATAIDPAVPDIDWDAFNRQQDERRRAEERRALELWQKWDAAWRATNAKAARRDSTRPSARPPGLRSSRRPAAPLHRLSPLPRAGSGSRAVAFRTAMRLAGVRDTRDRRNGLLAAKMHLSGPPSGIGLRNITSHASRPMEEGSVPDRRRDHQAEHGWGF
jgi:hypothetical protein